MVILNFRFRKERWFDDERQQQVEENPVNNDDAAEGGASTEKGKGKKQKVFSRENSLI